MKKVLLLKDKLLSDGLTNGELLLLNDEILTKAFIKNNYKLTGKLVIEFNGSIKTISASDVGFINDTDILGYHFRNMDKKTKSGYVISVPLYPRKFGLVSFSHTFEKIKDIRIIRNTLKIECNIISYEKIKLFS